MLLDFGSVPVMTVLLLLLPRPTGWDRVAVRGEWRGLTHPLVFRVVVTSSLSSLLALVVLEDED